MSVILESLVTKDMPVDFGATTKSSYSVDGKQEEEITTRNVEQDIHNAPKEVVVIVKF